MLAIGFSTTGSLFSRAIRWFTGSKVSHVFILHEAYGGLYVMDATPGSGFRLVGYGQFFEENTVVYIHEITQDLLHANVAIDERLDRAASWLSYPYDYCNILWLALRLCRVGKISTPRSMQCAEAVVRFAPELFPSVGPESATPHDLMKILQGHKHE
jgi:hypothetical protein